jgi:predicted porin
MAALLCASLACAGISHAQSSVTISGLVDAYVGSMRNAGDAGSTSVVGSSGMTTSWLGFKGSEDLGGGLKSYFNLSSFLQPATGSAGRYAGDPFFSREANVGLSGGLGSLQLGRGLAPNFLPTILVSPFGDSYTFSPLALHAAIATTGWPYTTIPSDTGWSNQILYTTPSLGGLTANLHYQFGGQSSATGNASRNNAGLNLLYFGGTLTLVAFYERAQIMNPVNLGPITTLVGGDEHSRHPHGLDAGRRL